MRLNFVSILFKINSFLIAFFTHIKLAIKQNYIWYIQHAFSSQPESQVFQTYQHEVQHGWNFISSFTHGRIVAVDN